jgi:glycosidase
VKDAPTPTWFNGTEAKHLNETWQTWTLMDPNATYAVERDTLEGWFINLLPDLNQNDPETRQYLIQNTLWWIGMTGLDAIRQDTLPYVPRDFWRDWMAAIKRQYPWVRVVGEVMDGDPALVSFFQGGRAQFDGIDSGVDSVFDFPLFYPIRHAFAQGKPLREVAAMLAHDRLYTNPAMLVTTLGLHDLTRFMNEDGASIAGLKLAFTCLMTVRGVPMIYYGDEIAMPGGNDPDNRRDFPGGWPGDPRNAFEKSGRTPDEEAVFAHVQKVTRLRAELEPLRRGATRNLVVNEQTWAFERTAAGKSAIVVFNNAASTQRVSFALDRRGKWKDALGLAPELVAADGAASVAMPARTAAVYALP